MSDAEKPIFLNIGKTKDALSDFAFYRFIIDSLPAAVLTVNSKFEITSFNPWAEQVTGYSAEEALGHYCGDILQGGMCKLHCPLKTAIDRQHPIVRAETTIRRKDGERIPVRMNTAAMLDSDGTLIGAVEAFQDISDLKAMEREKDNIISMFAHDMKSSLTIIGGFALRLEKKAGKLNTDRAAQYLGIIRKEAEKLDFLVNDFLEFARLQTGKLKLNLQPTSLDTELQELFNAYQPRVAQSGIRLELHKEKPLPVIKADPNRLRRAFANLLDNAFKFSKRGSIITVSTDDTPKEVLVTVEDQGQGIDPEDLPFIFEIFRRGKSAGKKQGSGIGLAAVKAIVEGHGGRVRARSHVGKGSVFTVVLPKSKP
ncbi:MAG: PAS domain-containing sensor histidine kinase [Deltaproteobacteria bacterium]|nr:PAS domain-containing sensor histidine kinase [Deltaproteobacteria bacterium]MBW2045830.1 PAS domain-containing sensor histidine kinase [Deltaproteobacteria bacterium]MBW2301953.1 PAS domain-containing sensor histidine kinase [Deltaproteobacteria bacterium]